MPERRPTWGQPRRFCELQGFRPSRADHDFYDKVLSDGSTAGTKISFGVGETDQIPASLWPRIWRRQLRLRANGEFWQGVEGGPVAYDVPPTSEPSQPLPEYFARHLREDRRWPQDQIAAASREQAQQLLNEWYSLEQRP
jgi:hypothetical protein